MLNMLFSYRMYLRSGQLVVRRYVEVGERIMAEQLLNTISADLSIWIQERNINAAEAGNLAENYLQANVRDSRVGQRSFQILVLKEKEC